MTVVLNVSSQHAITHVVSSHGPNKELTGPKNKGPFGSLSGNNSGDTYALTLPASAVEASEGKEHLKGSNSDTSKPPAKKLSALSHTERKEQLARIYTRIREQLEAIQPGASAVLAEGKKQRLLEPNMPYWVTSRYIVTHEGQPSVVVDIEDHQKGRKHFRLPADDFEISATEPQNPFQAHPEGYSEHPFSLGELSFRQQIDNAWKKQKSGQ